MAIERFEDIEGWKLARELCRDIYFVIKLSEKFSRDWGLKDQITRAAGSVMHNIAEGYDAGTHPEFARFLSYAQRSCTEVQSELYMALDQEYIDDQQFKKMYSQAEATKCKIGGLIKYLKSK